MVVVALPFVAALVLLPSLIDANLRAAGCFSSAMPFEAFHPIADIDHMACGIGSMPRQGIVKGVALAAEGLVGSVGETERGEVEARSVRFRQCVGHPRCSDCDSDPEADIDNDALSVAVRDNDRDREAETVPEIVALAVSVGGKEKLVVRLPSSDAVAVSADDGVGGCASVIDALASIDTVPVRHPNPFPTVSPRPPRSATITPLPFSLW